VFPSKQASFLEVRTSFRVLCAQSITTTLVSSDLFCPFVIRTLEYFFLDRHFLVTKKNHPLMDLSSPSKFLTHPRYPEVNIFSEENKLIKVTSTRSDSLIAYKVKGSDLSPGFQPWLRYVFRFSQPLDVLFLWQTPGLVSYRFHL
jgi:hypothetical protein